METKIYKKENKLILVVKNTLRTTYAEE